MTIEAKRAARRAAMPVTTALMAEFADFAPVLIYASEKGRVYGKPPVYAEAFDIPTGYAPMAQIDTKGKRNADPRH